MKFKLPEQHNLDLAAGAELLKVKFDFSLKMKVKTSDLESQEVVVDPLYFAVAHKIPLTNLELMLENFPPVNYINPINGESAFSHALVKNNLPAAKLILR